MVWGIQLFRLALRNNTVFYQLVKICKSRFSERPLLSDLWEWCITCNYFFAEWQIHGILFMTSAVITCALEYLTSYGMEKMFHAIGWNYYGGFWCGVLTLLCGLLNDEQSVITARHEILRLYALQCFKCRWFPRSQSPSHTPVCYSSFRPILRHFLPLAVL